MAGSLNLYGYANQNPLSNIDPTGEFAFVLPALPALGKGLLTLGGYLAGGAAIAAIMSTPGDSPQAASVTLPEVGSGKWKVLTGCNVNKFGPNCDNCPDRVFGYGYGRDFLEAKRNGEIAANMQLKGLNGCQKRHCEPKVCWVNGNPVRCPNFK